MKNSTKTKQGKLVKALIALSFIMTISTAIAQPTLLKKGVSLTVSSTGNGFGLVYNPGVFIKVGKSQFEGILDIQKRNLNISGGQFTYKFNAFDGSMDGEVDAPVPCELFFFSTIRYSFNALLSEGQMKVERQVASDRQDDFASLHYSAVEAYAGFGLTLHLGSRVHLVNSIGIGGWATLEGRKNVDREYNSQSISLKTGLYFDLN